MTAADKAIRAEAFAQRLIQFSEQVEPLPGLTAARLYPLALQIVDSLRRIEFAQHLRDHTSNGRFADPNDPLFDPLRAAVIANNAGDVDEAYWLVFLATHFGKHATDRWRLAQDIYRAMGAVDYWTWAKISSDIGLFDSWAAQAIPAMKNDGIKRRFSNHRKYESLDNVPTVFRSYVEWVQPFGGHNKMIRTLHKQVGQDPKAVFDALYHEMGAIRQFGRLAKFDHLAMLGKLGISPIEPNTAHLQGATGPLAGARLLFEGSKTSALNWKKLQARLDVLDAHLNVGMQVLEDSLCNWQKAPETYSHFRG